MKISCLAQTIGKTAYQDTWYQDQNGVNMTKEYGNVKDDKTMAQIKKSPFISIFKWFNIYHS